MIIIFSPTYLRAERSRFELIAVTGHPVPSKAHTTNLICKRGGNRGRCRPLQATSTTLSHRHRKHAWETDKATPSFYNPPKILLALGTCDQTNNPHSLPLTGCSLIFAYTADAPVYPAVLCNACRSACPPGRTKRIAKSTSSSLYYLALCVLFTA